MSTMAQEIVQLSIAKNDPTVEWADEEMDYFSTSWQTRVITNVSQPSMMVYRAPEGIATGTSVVICPGGGLYAHSIESEGTSVAEWLSKRGVTAFVLKYRLVPTGEDGTKQLSEEWEEGTRKAASLLHLSVDDALQAISLIRSNAAEYNIDATKIGLMGFSAGGAVTMGATYSSNLSNRPDFIAPIYAWMDIVPKSEMPKDAGPAFIACASDDPLGLAPASVKIYQDWMSANNLSELHMYANGGHGFGMRPNGNNSDKWIEHFGEWLRGQGLL